MVPSGSYTISFIKTPRTGLHNIAGHGKPWHCVLYTTVYPLSREKLYDTAITRVPHHKCGGGAASVEQEGVVGAAVQ